MGGPGINPQMRQKYGSRRGRRSNSGFPNLTSLKRMAKRFKRTQFTASLKNEHTNWRVAKYRVYFKRKLMMKYPGEFMKSLNNGIKKHGLTKTFFREKALTINYLYLLLRINLGKIKKFNL